MFKKLSKFIFLVVVLSAILAYWGWSRLTTPAGGDAVALVTVERGSTLRPVLAQLEDAGVLNSARVAYAYARLAGRSQLRSGDYEFRASQNALEILAALYFGRVRLLTLTLAEGLNRWQVRDALVAEGWISAQKFDALCDDQAFLRSRGIPGPTCEGYLFPSTYKLARGTRPKVLFETMFHVYRAEYDAATRAGRGPLKLDEQKLVTLASIVEKETGAPQERPRIACVFYNRLRANPAWKLQTDPTVIYAATLAEPNFDGNIKRSHLRDFDHPYNTYKIHGLPPGPIANPGRAALDAVVSPASCDDFFFVSQNNGRHIFCPTLACHNEAVKTWQQEYFRKQRLRGQPD